MSILKRFSSQVENLENHEQDSPLNQVTQQYQQQSELSDQRLREKQAQDRAARESKSTSSRTA